MSIKRPLLVLGHARSGTTLLRALLNIHPQVKMVNEPHLVRTLRSVGASFDGTHEASLRPQVLDALSPNQRERLPQDVMDAFLASDQPFTFKEAYEALMPLDSEANEIWGEKSPENLRYLQGLLQLYPEAFFLNIVRDPRSIVLSKYRKKFHAAENVSPKLTAATVGYVIYIAMHWRAVVRYAQDNLLESAEHWGEVKYEDLVTDPEPSLRSICDGLGIGFDENMLNPENRQQEQAFKESRGKVHALLTEPIQKERAEGWRDLPEWAIWLVEQYCGSEMDKIGYTRANVTPSRPIRIFCKAILCLRKNALKHIWWKVMSELGADEALEHYL
jgi:hypothetical protein